MIASTIAVSAVEIAFPFVVGGSHDPSHFAERRSPERE